MKLTLSATTVAAFALLLETTDLASAKRLTEPVPPSAADDFHHKARVLSGVTISSVLNTRDGGIQKEKKQQLPPDGFKVSRDDVESSSRIIGGTEADLGEYPYFVDMNAEGCGGALIAPQVVLSAAHCTANEVSFVGKRVIVGAYRDGDSTTTGASRVRVVAQRLHPNFVVNNPFENDFMLLKLETAVDIADPKLSIATRGGPSNILEGTDLTVIGLGMTEDGSPESTASTLREVVVPVVDIDVCDNLYEGGIATDVMFCTGTCGDDAGEYRFRVRPGTLSLTYSKRWHLCRGHRMTIIIIGDLEEGGISPCFGDSGGPIVYKESSTKHVQLGVVSFGKKVCGGPDSPAVYANVGFARKWIKSVVCDQWELSADFCGDSNTASCGSNEISFSMELTTDGHG
jgi:secreted trypsin-like serine protease